MIKTGGINYEFNKSNKIRSIKSISRKNKIRALFYSEHKNELKMVKRFTVSTNTIKVKRKVVGIFGGNL